ncbi:MAG: hypothetical protein RLZZ210_455 [Pseudomonadota bacterium]
MNNITDVIIILGGLMPSLMFVLRTFAGLIGIYFIANALYLYYSVSNPQISKSTVSGGTISVGGATIQLIVGAMLTGFAQGDAVHSIVSSMLGKDTFTMPSSMSIINTDSASFSAIQESLGIAIENIMVLIGSIAIVRGLMLARRISLGLAKESMSAVTALLILGSLSLNIKDFAIMLDNTFGLHFSRFFV